MKIICLLIKRHKLQILQMNFEMKLFFDKSTTNNETNADFSLYGMFIFVFKIKMII